MGASKEQAKINYYLSYSPQCDGESGGPLIRFVGKQNLIYKLNSLKCQIILIESGKDGSFGIPLVCVSGSDNPSLLPWQKLILTKNE